MVARASDEGAPDCDRIEDAYPLESPGDHAAPQRGIGERPLDGSGEHVGILRVEQQRGVAGRLRYGGLAERDDRDAPGHRLDDRHAETFVFAARDEHVGCVVVRGEDFGAHGTGEFDGIGDTQRLAVRSHGAP